MELSNSKTGVGRPATTVLGANVANSVPPHLPDVDVGSRPEEHAAPPSSGKKYQPPAPPLAVSWTPSYEQVQCGLMFRRKDWCRREFF